MTRVEYLSQLDDSLKGLPEQERREAVEFYYNYFEDAKESGKTDEQIIEELGPVSKISAKIIAQCNFVAKTEASREAFKAANESHGNSSIFKGIKGLFLAIGAVMIGLPGALIVGIPVLAVMFSLLVAVIAIVFSLGVVMVVVPIALIIAAVACFIAVPVIGIAAVGWGLICIGVAILFGIVLYLAIYGIVKLISIIANVIMRAFANRRKQRATA
jgi:uncharacterized membrane protein